MLSQYTVSIGAHKEIRWTGKGQMKVNDYIIYYKGTDNIHHIGTGFVVHKNYESCVREFNPISERIYTKLLKTKPKEICLINIHAPTENSDKVDKDVFYDEITRIYDRLHRNLIKIVLGDTNAKVGKELMFVPTIRLESVHEESNDNGQRLIAFATSRSLLVSSTTFPQKNIHKHTWKSPDERTMNQIDHVLIAKKYRSSITDVRIYRVADCDMDHFLVICNFRLKLQKASRHFQKTPK